MTRKIKNHYHTSANMNNRKAGTTPKIITDVPLTKPAYILMMAPIANIDFMKMMTLQ